MAIVIVDGVEYAPKIEIKISDTKIKECLEILTSMRYFGENHKMQNNAWAAIHALSPNLASLEVNLAYETIHGDD